MGMFDDIWIPFNLEMNPIKRRVRIIMKGRNVYETDDYDDILKLLKETFDELPDKFKAELEKELKDAEMSD